MRRSSSLSLPRGGGGGSAGRRAAPRVSDPADPAVDVACIHFVLIASVIDATALTTMLSFVINIESDLSTESAA